MRILLISSSYVPVLGGLQNVTHRLAQFLAARGHQVRVITNRYPRNLAAFEIRDEISIWRYPLTPVMWSDLRRGRPDQILFAILNGLPVKRALDNFVREFKPDVINFHFPTYTSPFVSYLKEHWKLPLVVSLHGNDVWGLNQRSAQERRAYQHVIKNAEAITTCSIALLEDAAKYTTGIRKKATVAYNGVDTYFFKNAEAYQRQRPFVFAFGRFVPAKGFDLLIDAFAKVAPSFPEIDLILAGEGQEVSRLKQQAKERGVESRVSFFGRATSEQVAQLLHGCLFVVIPSRIEPFGIVALEAMSAGKFILASNVGGLKEVVPVPPNELTAPSVEDLAAAMSKILTKRSDPAFDESAIQKSNMEFAEGFTWEKSLSTYETIFENVIEKTHG